MDENRSDRPPAPDGHGPGAGTDRRPEAEVTADGVPVTPDPGEAFAPEAAEAPGAGAEPLAEPAADSGGGLPTDPVPGSADGGPAGPDAEPEPDWRDRYLRSVAELDNVRKRARRDAASGELRGLARLTRELLPALDNLDRALQHVEEAPQGDEQLIAGLRLVHGELQSALARVGVVSFDPAGQPFDPHLHEAMTQQPAPDGVEPGTVVAVYQAGYRLGDDVLRPAKVVVAG